MDTVQLYKRKSELLAQQELVLNQCQEAHTKLTDVQEAAFTSATAEIKDIDQTIARMDTITRTKAEIMLPTSEVFVPTEHNSTPKFSAEYRKAFWNYFRDPKNPSAILNANLGEGANGSGGYGTTDGGYLVPTRTDPTIANLAGIEASARKLSMVVTTDMDIKLPYQATKTIAAAKAESRTSNNPFAGTAPSFGTTTLTAYMAGVQIGVTWELLQDVGLLESFLVADANRSMVNYEENAFVVGGSDGATSPLGYLEGATAALSGATSINNVLALTGSLREAYFANAKFLAARQTVINIYKAQIAASQFQQYITYDADGSCRLLGYPVLFSSAMPVVATSPATSGALLFGDFAAGWVIGDRGGSALRAKVLDQVQAVNGATILLFWRRTDQRCRIQEAVQLLTLTS
jgi:HK97 family phage major capsid protein